MNTDTEDREVSSVQQVRLSAVHAAKMMSTTADELIENAKKIADFVMTGKCHLCPDLENSMAT